MQMRFRYIRYSTKPVPAYPHRSSIYRPNVIIRVKANNKISPRIAAIVDSGADFSIFHYNIADILDIRPEDGIRHDFIGAGGSATGFIHDGIVVEIGGHEVTLRAAFSKDVPEEPAILGREDFFETFKIMFNERKQTIDLKSYDSK